MRIQVIAMVFALVACEELVDDSFEALTYIDAVSPARVPARGGIEVTITGRNFEPDAVVLLNGVQMTAAVQDTTRITFISPPDSPGSKRLTVSTAEGDTVDASIRYAATDLFFGPRGPVLSIASRGVGWADLDQNGRDDVVVLGFEGISTFLNRDDGTRLDSMQTIPEAKIVGIVDVDGDGRGDLIEQAGIRYNGENGFGPLKSTSLAAENMAIHHLTAGDFDGDGVLDVAFIEGPPKLLGEASVGTLVFARTASGEHGNFERQPMASTIRSVDPRLTPRDLDKDGVDDLLVVDENNALFVIFSPLIPLDREIFPPLTNRLPAPVNFVLADTNADGYDDLVYEGFEDDGTQASLRAAGTGERRTLFEPPTRLPRFCGGPRPTTQLLPWKGVDIDGPSGDPREAIFLLANCREFVRVVTDVGGSLEPVTRLDVDEQFVLAAAELDGRGHRDVLLATPSGVRTYFGGRSLKHSPMLMPHRGFCLDGDCDGDVALTVGRFSEDHRFAAVQAERLVIFDDVDDTANLTPVINLDPGPEGRQTKAMRSGDLDGDGDDDLALVYLDRPDRLTASVTFVINEGERWRALPAFDPDGARAPINLDQARFLWDLDGDGAVEFVWGTRAGTLVWSLTSTGVAMNPLDDDEDGFFIGGMKSLDIDLDGTPDLYGLDGTKSSSVAVRFNRAGRFERASIPLELDIVISTLIEHRDDGALDVWVTGTITDLDVILQRYRFDLATGAVELLRTIALPIYYFEIHRAEIDGDGVPDLVLAPHHKIELTDPFSGTRGLVAVLPGAATEDGEIVEVDFARSSGFSPNAINWRKVSFFDVDDDGLDDLIYSNDAHAYEPVILKNKSR